MKTHFEDWVEGEGIKGMNRKKKQKTETEWQNFWLYVCKAIFSDTTNLLLFIFFK